LIWLYINQLFAGLRVVYGTANENRNQKQ